MNDDKTEIRPVGTKANLKSVPQTSSLTVWFYLPFSYKVRNLGVYLDSNLSMAQHVNLLCRSVFLELRRLGHFRHHLSADATKKLVSSFVLSRLDYCNFCWQISRKTGSIACREYKTMQLVLSLADEGETMQSLCSDLCIGCQSELGLNTRFPPCAIIAEIHLLLLTYVISLSVRLPALCVLRTLIS